MRRNKEGKRGNMLSRGTSLLLAGILLAGAPISSVQAAEINPAPAVLRYAKFENKLQLKYDIGKKIIIIIIDDDPIILPPRKNTIGPVYKGGIDKIAADKIKGEVLKDVKVKAEIKKNPNLLQQIEKADIQLVK